MQAEVTSAAKREQEMSKSDYISLSFSAAEKVILPVGAYINYTYKIDKVREVLVNTKESEYSPFKALLDLKEAGKHYNLEAISYK